jgi:GH15 family glucan-1,4-alpha-glucosidase
VSGVGDERYPPIGDYALIGDSHSAALVSRAGSIDWACFPRFDDPSVFGRVLDWDRGGYFQLAPLGVQRVERRYLPRTNILETTFHTNTGVATLTDFMAVHPHSRPETPRELSSRHELMRILRCTEGSVVVSMICEPRFDYGSVVPHVVHRDQHHGFAHGGGQAISVFCSAPLTEREAHFEAEARLDAGQELVAAAGYFPSLDHGASRPAQTADVYSCLKETREFWERWSAMCSYDGADRDAVLRSALTLKALTYAPSGALVAAPTTSLPEQVGGPLNWDYRFTWIRDATFALYSLLILGYTDEARAFVEWLEWTTAGRARDLQIMYGVGGERRLTEIELPDLEGYRGARPVRVGNAAAGQFQLDIYGELMDSAHLLQRHAGMLDSNYIDYLHRVVTFVTNHWREPDDGIWETRAGPQHFIYSKVMCWVAMDRAVKLAHGLGASDAETARWKELAGEIRAEVFERGYDAKRGAFVQAYGSRELDASALLLPLVGFVGADDPRMRSTIAAIERELTASNGLVYRNTEHGPLGTEGTFGICTFWLVDNLVFLGEIDRARELSRTVLSHSNDVGLFSEQINPRSGELMGNFPQAFTHLGHINSSLNLDRAMRGGQPLAGGGSGA